MKVGKWSKNHHQRNKVSVLLSSLLPFSYKMGNGGKSSATYSAKILAQSLQNQIANPTQPVTKVYCTINRFAVLHITIRQPKGLQGPVLSFIFADTISFSLHKALILQLHFSPYSSIQGAAPSNRILRPWCFFQQGALSNWGLNQTLGLNIRLELEV